MIDEELDIIAPEKNSDLAAPRKVEDGLSDLDKKNLELSAKNPAGGKWNVAEQRWEGYAPAKGVKPNWNPFDPSKRKNRVTLKERKFMAMLSTTGSMQEAYRAVYKVKDYGNPSLERARISALANQVLRRIREKDPALVSAMTFEDITPDFVKKEMLKLYNHSDASIHEKTRLLELMGKTQAMFTDKVQSETKITEVIDTVYRESDEDFPESDHRIGRMELEEKLNTA